MDQIRESEDLTAVIAQRVRELRTGRGWSAEKLAEAMTERAGVEWQRMVVVKLETGRRQDVSVRELLALAYVFDISPIDLLVPIDDDLAPYPVTPKVTVRRGRARAWIRRQFPLSSTDERRYFAEVPRDEWVPPGPPTSAEERRMWMWELQHDAEEERKSD